jgi:hypothetical protein
MKEQISDIKRFLTDFDKIYKHPKFEIKKEVELFFSALAPIFEKEEALDKQYARKYNIFNLLSLERNEVEFHTPFLTNLLDISGDHGQGTLFFLNFLNTLNDSKHTLKEIRQIKIDKEYYTRNGIIDIYITCISNAKPFYIIIENKIDAGDQFKQLERYHIFLEKTMRLKRDQFLIVYLTPNGSQPEIPYSISKENYIDLIKTKNLIELSYKSSIVKWLQDSFIQNIPPRLSATLEQYLQTINSL